MKTIGLLGSMSWESTALHYGQINKEVKNFKKDFYKNRISKNFGIEVLIPNSEDIKIELFDTTYIHALEAVDLALME